MNRSSKNRALSSTTGLLKAFRNLSLFEKKVTLIGFVWFFLLISGYYIIKIVRSTDLLDRIGAQNEPYLWIVVAAIIYFVAGAYNFLASKVRRDVLIKTGYLVIAVSLVIYSFLFGIKSQHDPSIAGEWPEFFKVVYYNLPLLISGSFYIWVSIINLFWVMMFFSLLNDCLRSEQAKLLYGPIGLGGLLGGAFGSGIASVTSKFVTVDYLLFISAFILVICTVLSHLLHNLHLNELISRGKSTVSILNPSFVNEGYSNVYAGMKLIFSNKYAVLIASLLFIYIFIGSIFTYQLNNMTQARFSDGGNFMREEGRMFWSNFYFYMNLGGFFIQLLITPVVLRLWDVRGGLMVLPVLATVGSAFFLINPAFTVIAVSALFAMAFTYSLNQSAKEVLFVPTLPFMNYKIKAVIDTFVFRFSDAAAALFILLASRSGSFSIRDFSYVSVILGVTWMGVVILVTREFRRQQSAEG